VWKTSAQAVNADRREYWRRLEILNGDFLGRGPPSGGLGRLGFTLAAGGVDSHDGYHPARPPWATKARLLEAGRLSSAEIRVICDRWRVVAAARFGR
jgi:hypothetical protein